MRIELGPYRSSAAHEWLAHARELVTLVAANRAQLPFNLPDEIVDELRWYIDEWDTAASKADEFRWAGDVDRGDLRNLLTYWLNLARVSNDRPELGVSAEGAREFYPAVVSDILDALAAHDADAAFSRRLRAAWPGLSEVVECRTETG